jgi:uncharacterized protein YdhG (YjbR/CyaY superfamily)
MEFATVDDYIASQPAETQPILQEVRKRCHQAVPGAGEMISYGIPTITLDGHYVVYFAGWKHHLSVYPVPHGDEELQAEMAPYLTGKGTLNFPRGEPIPYDMIEKVAARLAAERQGRK